MLDDFLLEQPLAVKILKNAINKNKIVHAYLFETNGYHRKEDLIFSFIKSLLCPNKFFASNKCSKCNVCQMIEDKCYPEVKIINPDGMWIKKEQLDELQQEFSKKAVIGTKKIYIINEAEKMNTSAANSILKFIEEPVPNIIAILVTDNIYQLLDTIISRCQIVTLKKTRIENQNELEIIANNIFSDNLKKDEFLNNENSIEQISAIKSFIKYYEKNKLDILLYTQKMWFNYFSDKEKNLFAYDIMILYYRDVLNVKIGHPIMIFKDDYEILLKISSNLTEYEICDKIDKIVKAKEKIKNNINLNLLMDKLMMELEGMCKND